jgi:DNA repair protein RecO (recombination protein O)
MEWQDVGILLRLQELGEDQLIGVFLTKEHGCVRGIMPFKSSDTKRDKMVHPGSRAQVRWKSRLSEHLGRFDVDPEYSPIAKLIHDPEALAGLSSICSIVETWTPEREPHEHLFFMLQNMIDNLTSSTWPVKYVQFEVELLRELGFGLDLETCALTGAKSNLIYVSPDTGRALSQKAIPIKVDEDHLLPLPSFLSPTRVNDEWTWEQILQGMELTGHFFQGNLCAPVSKDMPIARERLIGQFKSKAS